MSVTESGIFEASRPVASGHGHNMDGRQLLQANIVGDMPEPVITPIYNGTTCNIAGT